MERTGNGFGGYPLAFYPELIEWKIKSRNESNTGDLNSTLNFSIIIDCACLIELALNSIINELLINSNLSEDEVKNRLLEMLMEKHEKGQFNDYITIYEILIGKSPKKIVDEELWKSIKILFQYRNKLVHGNSMEFFEVKDKGNTRLEAFDSYKNIFAFIKEKKLAKINLSTEINEIMATDQIIDYFYNCSIAFIKELVNNIPEHTKMFIETILPYAFEEN